MLVVCHAPVNYARQQLVPTPLFSGYKNRSVAPEGGLFDSDRTLFDVTQFGAVGDGKTYDTVAVRDATAAVSHNGGGTLLFPGGTSERTYLTGAFNLTSNVIMIVEAGATLLGSPHSEDWPLVEPLPWYGGGSDQQQQGTREYQALVHADGASNVTLTGGGVINGNGMHWWRCKENTEWDHASPPCGNAQGVYHSRPHLIMIVRGSDVKVTNLTVIDSPNWTLHFAMVNGLLVANNSVHSPGTNAPNTDGINLDCTQDALVEDNYVAVGDDALCVKSGIDYLGRTFGKPSQNITFRRNTIGTGHGITIGSEMSAGVSYVIFEDITMDRTNVGIRLKSQRGRGGVVQNVTYRNIHMKSIDEECVQVTLNYHGNGHSTETQTNWTATPAFNDIAFENVLCEHGKASYFLDGLPERAIKRLSLINITMGLRAGTEKRCAHAVCTCDALTMPCPSCCTPDYQLLATRDWMPSAGRRGPSAQYLEIRDRLMEKERRKKEEKGKLKAEKEQKEAAQGPDRPIP